MENVAGVDQRPERVASRGGALERSEQTPEPGTVAGVVLERAGQRAVLHPTAGGLSGQPVPNRMCLVLRRRLGEQRQRRQAGAAQSSCTSWAHRIRRR